MADQKKDKQMQIDEMLDSLLANYSSAEPRPGLETRILANLHEAEKTPQGWGNFKWIWAGAVAAAIIVAAMLINGRHRVAPPTNAIVETKQPAPQPQIQPPVAPQATARIRRHKPSTVPAVRQNATLALSERPAVFPTPTPLSEQEQLLLRYYAGTPREEMIAQSHPDEPPVVGEQDQTEVIPDLTHIPQKLSNTR
ncbi:MAG TPA: hypothetical protein VGK36_15465 [Candidatus Angelobacter sp.]|jgi:hypothetical protein